MSDENQAKKPEDKPEGNQHTREFQTHIKEPRWQQIVSVTVIVAIIVFWLIEQF